MNYINKKSLSGVLGPHIRSQWVTSQPVISFAINWLHLTRHGFNDPSVYWWLFLTASNLEATILTAPNQKRGVSLEMDWNGHAFCASMPIWVGISAPRPLYTSGAPHVGTVGLAPVVCASTPSTWLLDRPIHLSVISGRFSARFFAIICFCFCFNLFQIYICSAGTHTAGNSSIHSLYGKCVAQLLAVSGLRRIFRSAAPPVNLISSGPIMPSQSPNCSLLSLNLHSTYMELLLELRLNST